MTNVAGIASSNRLHQQFAYDYLGRRISKAVFNWHGSGFGPNPVRQTTFVYDGWNLKAELGLNNALLRSYTWGNDLSGTMTQAGGVSGLLMANLSGTNCFAGYDGNGNLTAFINAADKSLAARYEYSPYGQLIRETGLLAAQIPFRYSTKFWDEESGLVYYGHRYYSPSFGRWASRDSSQEKGGVNLYGFCHSCPIFHFDTLGDMDYSGVLDVEHYIRTTLENIISTPIVGEPMAFAVMTKWFLQGGDYDYKTINPGTLENYDAGLSRPLQKDEFGNFIAGYAAGVAWMKSGNADFASGVYAGGLYYRVKDIPNCDGFVDWAKRFFGQISMIHDGMLEGVADELFAEF